jgi:hypothetical protein
MIPFSLLTPLWKQSLTTGTLVHDAVMAVQASQLKQLRSELLPLTVVESHCVSLIALSPPEQVVQSLGNQ